MAAVTETNKYQTVEGDHRVVYVDIAAPANNDTWVTGLKSVRHVSLEANALPSASYWSVGYSISGGTVTFLVRGTAPVLKLKAVGS